MRIFILGGAHSHLDDDAAHTRSTDRLPLGDVRGTQILLLEVAKLLHVDAGLASLGGGPLLTGFFTTPREASRPANWSSPSGWAEILARIRRRCGQRSSIVVCLD